MTSWTSTFTLPPVRCATSARWASSSGTPLVVPARSCCPGTVHSTSGSSTETNVSMSSLVIASYMVRTTSASVTLDLGADALTHDGDDFAGLSVALQRSLGEDQLVVEGDLEAAARRRHELDVLDDRGPAVQQFVRQTDGTRHVVSGNTELDAEVVTRVEHRIETTGGRGL